MINLAGKDDLIAAHGSSSTLGYHGANKGTAKVEWGGAGTDTPATPAPDGSSTAPSIELPASSVPTMEPTDIPSTAPTLPVVDCETSSWQSWTECSLSCDGGETTRLRTVTVSQSGGGAPCGPLQQLATCNAMVCPVHWHTVHTVNCFSSKNKIILDNISVTVNQKYQ